MKDGQDYKKLKGEINEETMELYQNLHLGERTMSTGSGGGA